MSQNRLSSLLGSARLSTVVIAVGLLLFVVPEPITSILGALVVLVGAVGWLGGRLL